MTRHLLIIDPQGSFMDAPVAGELAVPGATADMRRLAAYIDAEGDDIGEITVTLDSHNFYDIGHPAFWQDAQGDSPAPFTLVFAADVRDGRILPRDPALMTDVLAYLDALEAGGRYVHIIWPSHCILGTPGHAVQPDLMAALNRWSARKTKAVNWVFKGLNPMTEHYSAVKAEVPVPGDAHTEINLDLVRALIAADTILVGGEALSHCVKSTVMDALSVAMSTFGIDLAPRLILLRDAMSPVPQQPGGPDFPAIGEAFLADMEAGGAEIAFIGG